jgi:diguanylate cyclase (GGDEF)-like protein
MARPRIPPALQLEVVAGGLVIDLLLTPIGLIIATAGLREPLAPFALLALLALLAAAAVERRNRIEEGVRRLDDLASERALLERALRRVGDAFASKLDRAALVDIFLQTALEALRADRALALLPGGRAECGVPEDPAASPRSPAPSPVRIGAGDDRAHRRRACRSRPLARRLPGVLCVVRANGPFAESEEELFGHLCLQASTAIENVELHDRLRREATQDELTGLANHRRFQEVLAEALTRADRTAQPLALVMLDIDDFKAVNDRHGHQEGDAVLRAVARAVRDTSRRTDEPARYGGEELAVVLPDTDLEGAYELAEDLRRAVAGLHLRADGPSIPLTVSVGVAAVDCDRRRPRRPHRRRRRRAVPGKRTGKNRTVRGTLGSGGKRGDGLFASCPSPVLRRGRRRLGDDPLIGGVDRSAPGRACAFVRGPFTPDAQHGLSPTKPRGEEFARRGATISTCDRPAPTEPTGLRRQKPRRSRGFRRSGRQDLNLRPPGPQPEHPVSVGCETQCSCGFVVAEVSPVSLNLFLDCSLDLAGLARAGGATSRLVLLGA